MDIVTLTAIFNLIADIAAFLIKYEFESNCGC